MKTDLARCKKIAEALFDIPMNIIHEFGVVQHPWISSLVCPTEKMNELSWVTYEDDNFLDVCRHRMEIQLESCNSVSSICFYMNKPYRLLYIQQLYKYNCISPEDMGVVLQDIWTTIENISQDSNLTFIDLVDLFNYADNSTLMSEEDHKVFEELPDRVTLYRGVNSINMNELNAMSWSTSFETAKWFANRFKDEHSQVWKIHLSKSKILAYFSTRNEFECVINPMDIGTIIKIKRIMM